MLLHTTQLFFIFQILTSLCRSRNPMFLEPKRTLTCSHELSNFSQIYSDHTPHYFKVIIAYFYFKNIKGGPWGDLPICVSPPTSESRITGLWITPLARQRLGKHVSVAVNTYQSINLLLNYIIRLCPLNPKFYGAQTNTSPLKTTDYSYLHTTKISLNSTSIIIII
jgi:hypothetical protein